MRLEGFKLHSTSPFVSIIRTCFQPFKLRLSSKASLHLLRSADCMQSCGSSLQDSAEIEDLMVFRTQLKMGSTIGVEGQAGTYAAIFLR
ncbi:hypothetical protein M758_10G077800 [Ceratodon purpureus]|nr:hypothetical protein M758_10G077800 [Ceratodon purpureus]